MRVTLKSIGILSAFKVGCFMSFLPILAVVAILLLAPIVINTNQGPMNITGAMTLPIILYGIGAGFLAGLGMALWAALYDLVALLFGGFVIKLGRRGR